MSSYKVHFNNRLATRLANEGSHEFRSGSWFAPRMGMPGTGGKNRAQCQNKAQQIDWTTNPEEVTCSKCITTI